MTSEQQKFPTEENKGGAGQADDEYDEQGFKINKKVFIDPA